MYVCVCGLPLGIRPVPLQEGQSTVSPELRLLLEPPFLLSSFEIIDWLSSCPLWLETAPIPEETQTVRHLFTFLTDNLALF